jgi:hypothetical protein
MDGVFGQVIEPGSGHAGQVNGQELDDKKVVVRHVSLTTRESLRASAQVAQP